MSNTATAFGFKHYGFLPGSAPDYQLSTRLIASSNTTSIGIAFHAPGCNYTADEWAVGADTAMYDAKADSRNRYAILFRVQNAKMQATRLRKIDEFITMLERGETIHP